jgi:hypothetical protein
VGKVNPLAEIKKKMSTPKRARGPKPDLTFGHDLALYRIISKDGKVHVSQDDLRKAQRHCSTRLKPEFIELCGNKAGPFREHVTKNTSQKTRKTLSACRSIKFQEAHLIIADEDRSYLRWFMQDRIPESYECLLVKQGALETQTALLFFQSEYGCMDEYKKTRGERCGVVFSHKTKATRCVVVINSDRLDALRIVSLPHIDQTNTLPFHPLYIRRLAVASAGVNSQWRYRYTIKSILVYFSMLTSGKWRPTTRAIVPMGSKVFNIYAMLPKVMNLWDSDSEIQKLVKDAYLDPGSQFNFVRGLRAFVMQDAKHWIHVKVFEELLFLLRRKKYEFPIQYQIIIDVMDTQGAKKYKTWIEISQYAIGSRVYSEFAKQRKPAILKDRTGSIVDKDIPLHSLLYQLLFSDEVPVETRRRLFLGMSVDPNPEKNAKSPPTLYGYQRWMLFDSRELGEKSYESYIKPAKGRSVQVMEPHELVSMTYAFSALEFASRMVPTKLKASDNLSNSLKPRLKHILSGEVDFPVCYSRNGSLQYYMNSFPSVEFPLDFTHSKDAVGSRLTREFVEYHYLLRDPAYYETCAEEMSDEEDDDDDEEDVDDDEELDVDEFMDSCFQVKRAKRVVVKYSSSRK